MLFQERKEKFEALLIEETEEDADPRQSFKGKGGSKGQEKKQTGDKSEKGEGKGDKGKPFILEKTDAYPYIFTFQTVDDQCTAEQEQKGMWQNPKPWAVSQNLITKNIWDIAKRTKRF